MEAKDAALQMKTEADKEIKERRNELSRQERRLDQKEEALDKRFPRWSRRRKTSASARSWPKPAERGGAASPA